MTEQAHPEWDASYTAGTPAPGDGVIKRLPACCFCLAVVPPLSRAGATAVMGQLRRSSDARHGAAGLRLA